MLHKSLLLHFACPFEDCEYTTPDVDPVLATALITGHATIHGSTNTGAFSARAEKVKVYHSLVQ